MLFEWIHATGLGGLLGREEEPADA
jgi:hypothetical protein